MGYRKLLAVALVLLACALMSLDANAVTCRCTGTIHTEGGERDVYFAPSCGLGKGSTLVTSDGQTCGAPTGDVWYWEPAVLISLPYLRNGNGLLNGSCYGTGGVDSTPSYTCNPTSNSTLAVAPRVPARWSSEQAIAFRERQKRARVTAP